MFTLQAYYANNHDNILQLFSSIYNVQSMYILGNTFFHESKVIYRQ